MPAAASVLLVEDDERLASLLLEYFGEHGVETQHATTAAQAYCAMANWVPDVILLDWMLPGEDGMAMCRKIRSSYKGTIVMLTARRSDRDQVEGLEGGADDYVIKPVDPRVLLARIRSHMRRATPNEPVAQVFGELHVDVPERTAYIEGSKVRFTEMEARVLCMLAQHVPNVVTRELLTQAVRGVEYDGIDRGIDIHISRIRRKLRNADAGARIVAVRGEGYCLREAG